MSPAIALIRANAAAIDGSISPARDYADYMAGYLGINRDSIAVIPLGLNLTGHASSPKPRDGNRPAIGYFGRIAPEKGLHVLVDAFIRLRRRAACRDRDYGCQDFWARISTNTSPANERNSSMPASKTALSMLNRRHCGTKYSSCNRSTFSPSQAVFREPKGLYVLEMLAHGVPVVQPEHGPFPELIQATGGGRLVLREDPQTLAETLLELLNDEPQCRRLGQAGRAAIEREFTDVVMARRTAEHYSRFVT